MDVTPGEFNQALLQSKRRALSALDELIATAAAPPRKPQPTTRPDGTYLTYEERNILNAARPPHPTIDELELLVKDRLARIRAAVAILRTRPVDRRGNPLPIRSSAPDPTGQETDEPAAPDGDTSQRHDAAHSSRALPDRSEAEPVETEHAQANAANAATLRIQAHPAGPRSAGATTTAPSEGAPALPPGLPRAYARAP
ncbi:MAG: hypothetical protein K2Q09_02960 [Phycisphaerales bacterium]|nr:hypothetical protein [Phycisphaerales bacterium]